MKHTQANLAAIMGSALLFSASAIAQFIPGDVVTIDVRSVLSQPWKHVGSVDASDYSYQVSHAIKYAGRSPASQTINVDVLMRESVRGSNGQIAETTLSYIEVMCYPDHTFPSKFVLHGAKTFDTDDNGLPGAPVDDFFRFYANDAQVVTVQQGSPGARLQQIVCRNAST